MYTIIQSIKKSFKVIKLVFLFSIVFSLGLSLPVNASQACEEIKKDLKTLKEDPGYYYFQIGLCEFQYMHDQKQFDTVAETLTKSSQYDYAPSYFALGLLYDNKFREGTVWLGSKGNLNDLLKSIENYKKAAANQSAAAENNLGEIYLHEANLDEEYKMHHDSDGINGVSEILPNIDQAIHWLELAAKHGNPAAQGTLSDLYSQGIGVPQDFVMAYVWQNLSVASQFRYNKKMQSSAMGQELLNAQQLIAKKQYNKLTEMQKNEAQALLKEYSKLYFKPSTKLDEVCREIQSYIAGTVASIYLTAMQDFMNKKGG